MNHRKANRMTVGFHREQHGMTRIDIDTGIPFAQFIAAFEKAAPPVDRTTLERIAKAGGDWDDVRAAAAENAPNDLMMYAKIDARDLLRPLRDTAPRRSSTWSATTSSPRPCFGMTPRRCCTRRCAC